MRFSLSFGVLMLAMLSAAVAGPIGFSSGWTEQRFSLFSSNDFRFGDRLEMTSDDSVSLVWRRVSEAERKATRARWQWQVEHSVPKTDLRKKGGDDRNFALYFVFVDDEALSSLNTASIRKLLKSEHVHVLLYTWGGNHARGAQFLSPYMRGRGQNIILREAQVGDFSESVNLDRDFRTAFGAHQVSLVGLAVSGDSDDTNSEIKGFLQGLVVE